MTQKRKASEQVIKPRIRARLTSGRVNVIDLFAGAGGLSVGAHLAGANVAASVELDRFACQTLRANAKYHGSVIEGDVCNLSGDALRAAAGLKDKDPLIIVGGPPCQPFSKAAYWTESGDDAAYRRARANGVAMKRPPAPTEPRKDERRDLVREFMHIVLDTRADGFVFENVPSIKHPRNRPIYEALVSTARHAGYDLVELDINAAEYGVAQMRQRVVVLGSKRGAIKAPRPSHRIHADSAARKAAVTAAEALEGLDGQEYFEPEELITGRWATHLSEVPPGWNYKAHTAWAGHPNPTFVTETRFWNFLLKLAPDRPSWTIAATPGPWTGPFHWSNRRLRIPELGALQGFPRGYIIEGSRRERVRQMGNAVPVPVAKAMVGSVIASFG